MGNKIGCGQQNCCLDRRQRFEMSDKKDAFERWLPIALFVAAVLVVAFGVYEAIVVAGVLLH